MKPHQRYRCRYYFEIIYPHKIQHPLLTTIFSWIMFHEKGQETSDKEDHCQHDKSVFEHTGDILDDADKIRADKASQVADRIYERNAAASCSTAEEGSR